MLNLLNDIEKFYKAHVFHTKPEVKALRSDNELFFSIKITFLDVISCDSIPH